MKKAFKGYKHKNGMTFYCIMCHQRKNRSGGVQKDKDGLVIGYACFKCAIKQLKKEGEDGKKGSSTGVVQGAKRSASEGEVRDKAV